MFTNQKNQNLKKKNTNQKFKFQILNKRKKIKTDQPFNHHLNSNPCHPKDLNHDLTIHGSLKCEKKWQIEFFFDNLFQKLDSPKKRRGAKT